MLFCLKIGSNRKDWSIRENQTGMKVVHEDEPKQQEPCPFPQEKQPDDGGGGGGTKPLFNPLQL